jgi:hypothetical protein
VGQAEPPPELGWTGADQPGDGAVLEPQVGPVPVFIFGAGGVDHTESELALGVLGEVQEDGLSQLAILVPAWSRQFLSPEPRRDTREGELLIVGFWLK